MSHKNQTVYSLWEFLLCPHSIIRTQLLEHKDKEKIKMVVSDLWDGLFEGMQL